MSHRAACRVLPIQRLAGPSAIGGLLLGLRTAHSFGSDRPRVSSHAPAWLSACAVEPTEVNANRFARVIGGRLSLKSAALPG